MVLYRKADERGAAVATKGAAHEAASCVPEAERDLASLVEPQVRQRDELQHVKSCCDSSATGAKVLEDGCLD